jgi:hypothetical protein
MSSPFPFDELAALIGDQLGTHDVACPLCGPQAQRTAANQRRRVLRIWHPEPGFVAFYCARCTISGYAVDDDREPVSRAVLEKTRRKAEALEREKAADRRATARWLWLNSRPLAGTIAERYLRDVRGIAGTLPGTLRFKPATADHPPALIAAFGIPTEPAPSVLAIAHTQVEGVHLTRLLPDGLGKDEHGPSKIMIAKSLGWPIVLAPLNDGGGLGIVEGIEDGLSVATATGLGVWVAGSASRLPALAERVPSHAESITIFGHDDDAGHNGARALAAKLRERGLEVAVEGLS